MDSETCDKGKAACDARQMKLVDRNDSTAVSVATPSVDIAKVGAEFDDEALRKALWELLAGSMEAGCETLLSELGAVSSKMSMTASLAETEREVTKFMEAVSPQLKHQFEQMVKYFRLYLLPTCTLSTNPPENPSSDLSERKEQEMRRTKEMSNLLKTLSSTNKTIEQVTQMHQKTKAQIETLSELWETIPSNLTSSIAELNMTLETAKRDLAESTRLINELHPASAPIHPFEYSAFSDGAAAFSSSPSEHGNHQTSSSTILPSHEHDPLLFFVPAAATVFKAASADGLVDEQTSTMCDLLME